MCSLSFQESLYTYQEILLSTLNFTSKFVHIPAHVLQGIDKDIFQSIKKLDPNPFSGLHKIGFYSSIGFRILPLEEQNKIISISESFVTLTDDSPAGETTQIRAKSLTNKKGVLTTNKYDPHNRLARCLIYGKHIDVKFKDNSSLVEQLLENPIKCKMILDTGAQIPPLNNKFVHKIYVSSKSYKGNPISSWIINCTYPLAFQISGTYATKEISTLLLIGVIFCAEKYLHTGTHYTLHTSSAYGRNYKNL